MPITTGVKCQGIILLIHGHFYRRKILQYIDNVTNILCHCLNTPRLGFVPGSLCKIDPVAPAITIQKYMGGFSGQVVSALAFHL